MPTVRTIAKMGNSMGIPILRSRDETLVIQFIISELKKNPVFANIFATHNYEELIAKIKPFEDTGGLVHDLTFMQKYEVQTLCRKVLAAMAGQ